MRAWLMGAAAAALAAGAATAASAQELDIENAAARVVVIPEARADVAVTVTQGSAQLPPLEVRRRGDGGVEIDGGLRRRIRDCGGGAVRGAASTPLNPDPNQTVEIRGVGRVRVADLPLITARVPMQADVASAGAVWGSVGRTQSLELASAGCGDWTAANVADALSVSLAGSGDVAVGSSRRAEVSVAGSGDVRLGPVAGGLEASIAGSGDIHAASVGGNLDASIAGSGDIAVAGGRLGNADVSILGSGDVRIDGIVDRLDVSIAGSGDVRVAQVINGVDRSVMGSGDVIVAGRALASRRD